MLGATLTRLPYQVPDFLTSIVQSRVLSFGGGHRGVQMMQHGVAWLGLVAGAKLWHVAPPNLPRPSNRECDNGGKVDWALAASEGVEHCVMKAGEVIFVPDDWWHATCNLEPYTVGVGAQARAAAALAVATAPAQHPPHPPHPPHPASPVPPGHGSHSVRLGVGGLAYCSDTRRLRCAAVEPIPGAAVDRLRRCGKGLLACRWALATGARRGRLAPSVGTGRQHVLASVCARPASRCATARDR